MAKPDKSVPKTQTSQPFNWKKWAVVGAIVVVILIIVGWIVGSYNSLVTLDQGVQAQWSKVNARYQERADKIPNLVNTVKGYMKYEGDLLTSITELRSQWTASATVDDKVK